MFVICIIRGSHIINTFRWTAPNHVLQQCDQPNPTQKRHNLNHVRGAGVEHQHIGSANKHASRIESRAGDSFVSRRPPSIVQATCFVFVTFYNVLFVLYTLYNCGIYLCVGTIVFCLYLCHSKLDFIFSYFLIFLICDPNVFSYFRLLRSVCSIFIHIF